MKIINRTQAMRMAQLIAIKSGRCISASELSFESVDVCPDGTINVVIYDESEFVPHQFIIDNDTINLLDGGS
jgi:hypothetical protein